MSVNLNQISDCIATLESLKTDSEVIQKIKNQAPGHNGTYNLAENLSGDWIRALHTLPLEILRAMHSQLMPKSCNNITIYSKPYDAAGMLCVNLSAARAIKSTNRDPAARVRELANFLIKAIQSVSSVGNNSLVFNASANNSNNSNLERDNQALQQKVKELGQALHQKGKELESESFEYLRLLIEEREKTARLEERLTVLEKEKSQGPLSSEIETLRRENDSLNSRLQERDATIRQMGDVYLQGTQDMQKKRKRQADEILPNQFTIDKQATQIQGADDQRYEQFIQEKDAEIKRLQQQLQELKNQSANNAQKNIPTITDAGFIDELQVQFCQGCGNEVIDALIGNLPQNKDRNLKLTSLKQGYDVNKFSKFIDVLNEYQVTHTQVIAALNSWSDTRYIANFLRTALLQ